MNDEIVREAEIVWGYMQVDDRAGDADCLLVLGSRDDRVARYAAGLIQKYRFETVVITGGDAHQNELLATNWVEPTEAEHFAAVMKDLGTTRSVLLETKAQNTGQNAVYSYQTLIEAGSVLPRSILLVTKPYMERRAKATFEAQWPDKTVALYVSSARQTLIEYVDETQPVDTVINIMAGDLEYIMEYPKRGFQSP